jgi:uncharacterized protein (DUF1501 family)
VSSRRAVLGGMAGSLAGLWWGMPGLALAAAPAERRLVVVLLRGGMDGLSVVPAIGDPDFVAARQGLAPDPRSLHRLDAMFALHPRLLALAGMYARGELAVIHAVATPYRERSHFDGQNLLESGDEAPYARDSGWLNRALAGLSLPGSRRSGGIALNAALPLILRGTAGVTSWSPAAMPGPDLDTEQRLAQLYAHTDPALADAFARAARANGVAARPGPGGRAFSALMEAAARFLKQPDGPRVAVAEIGGWDTHVNQATENGALANNLGSLDRGIEALRLELGPLWAHTAVLAISEFGRTVAQNGTRGTDHGTGGAMFLAGGAVRGGRVVVDWPGLKPAQRHEGRDLLPTTDFRAVALGVLRDHMGLEAAHHSSVFPATRPVRPLDGLIVG